jgi:hypothetical protein
MSRVPDADELDKRLLAILARPRANAGHRYPNPDQLSQRRDAELADMRRYIDELEQTVRPYTTAGEEMFDKLAGQFPTIHWDRRHGVFRGTLRGADPDEVAEVAAYLRLPQDDRVSLGCRAWTGRVETWRVSLTFVPQPRRIAC